MNCIWRTECENRSNIIDQCNGKCAGTVWITGSILCSQGNQLCGSRTWKYCSGCRWLGDGRIGIAVIACRSQGSIIRQCDVAGCIHIKVIIGRTGCEIRNFIIINGNRKTASIIAVSGSIFNGISNRGGPHIKSLAAGIVNAGCRRASVGGSGKSPGLFGYRAIIGCNRRNTVNHSRAVSWIVGLIYITRAGCEFRILHIIYRNILCAGFLISRQVGNGPGKCGSADGE